jgi:hypothetical protein
MLELAFDSCAMLWRWPAGWERDAVRHWPNASAPPRRPIVPPRVATAGWSTRPVIRVAIRDCSRSGAEREMAGKAASSTPSTSPRADAGWWSAGFLRLAWKPSSAPPSETAGSRGQPIRCEVPGMSSHSGVAVVGPRAGAATSEPAQPSTDAVDRGPAGDGRSPVESCDHDLWQCLHCGNRGCDVAGCEWRGFVSGLCRLCGHFEKVRR